MPNSLFDPIRLRGLDVRNRLWVSPMSLFEVIERDGIATGWHFLHLSSLARGGAGGIITEATAVSPDARISPYDLGLWNGPQQDALTPIINMVHQLGAKIGVQLAHAGRKGSIRPKWGTDEPHGSLPREHGGWQTVAPSSLSYPGMSKPLPLDTDGIEAVIESFGSSAARAEEAGFDMIEIHAGHGYLIHQFLSPLSNTRKDEYGGSLENRSRLLNRIVVATRARIGNDIPLLVRLSATDWKSNGLSLDDTVSIAGQLSRLGVDLVTVSTGGLVPADMPRGPGFQVPYATAVRQATNLATASVGLITEPAQAEQIVATGLADIVMVGRAFLRNANFGLDAAADLGVPIPYRPRPYLRAYQ